MKKLTVFGVFFALFLGACGADTPVKRLQSDLDSFPEYSIVLQDMKEEGNFFSDYFHRYKVITGEKVDGADSVSYRTEILEWEQVEEKFYKDHANYLGMVLASKGPDGKVSDSKEPPGYQYVGNPQYGTWRTDNSGNSFWAWYGKYAMMSSVFGMFNRPIYRNDFDDYRSYRRSGRPYYGSNNRYGTSGSYTQQSNKSFYDRRVAKETAKKQSFAEKVKQRSRKTNTRTSRSNMSSVRSRSSRGGK